MFEINFPASVLIDMDKRLSKGHHIIEKIRDSKQAFNPA